ncbi:MAG TPA: thioesterase family protein [Chitinophagaceae bacterium]|nr:thioesterase family protein [Chitinophagaceae bacterium]
MFKTRIRVRISDINYGGHLGNDRLLGLLHEARLQFLQEHEMTEMEAGGCGLIMADSAIQYKAEAFYGDELMFELAVILNEPFAFDMFYRVSKEQEQGSKIVALAKTGMICFDYQQRKMVPMPEQLKTMLTAP